MPRRPTPNERLRIGSDFLRRPTFFNSGGARSPSRTKLVRNCGLGVQPQESQRGFYGELLIVQVIVDTPPIVSFGQQHTRFNSGFVVRRYPDFIPEFLPLSCHASVFADTGQESET